MIQSNIDNLIEQLSEFVMPERYESLASRVDMRTKYMVLCLEDIFYPHNASATIRSAEAFGIQEIHAVESTCAFSPSRNIVRGTDQWVDLVKWKNTQELVQNLRQNGYRIVVTAPRKGGSTLENFDVNAGKFAVFMGTEKTGISEWLLQNADDAIYIPMVGFAESLNISVSAAIVTQELTRRVRKLNTNVWKLSSNDHKELLLKWLKASIKDVDNIIKRLK